MARVAEEDCRRRRDEERGRIARLTLHLFSSLLTACMQSTSSLFLLWASCLCSAAKAWSLPISWRRSSSLAVDRLMATVMPLLSILAFSASSLFLSRSSRSFLSW